MESSRPQYAALLLVHGQSILLGQRSFGMLDDKGHFYATTVGGGKVEPGETPREAAIREASEETFHLVSIDPGRLNAKGPDHFHSGRMWDSSFWVYRLTDDEADLLSVERLQACYEQKRRDCQRRYTEFSHFEWAPISCLKTGKSPLYTLFPPTVFALNEFIVH